MFGLNPNDAQHVQSRPVVALCKWHWRDMGEHRWVPYDDAPPTPVRASMGPRIVTVWLPQGAVIRLGVSKHYGQAGVFTTKYRHSFGRNGDRRQISIRIVECPTTEGPQ